MTFINHIFATAPTLPLIGSYLYEYVVAGNGLFVRAKRPELEALIPVKTFHIAGLEPVTPYVAVWCRVPRRLISQAVLWSVEALPNEALFWFGLDVGTDQWTIHRPRQTRSRTSVQPVDPYDRFGSMALIDLHSHNTMPPFFSRTDNKDETGFRIYAVIGSINPRSNIPPRIKVRVGIYGHMWDVPASMIFDLPSSLVDVLTVDEEAI